MDAAIPRRWLYEEDEASGDDDVLVTVPKREWVYCSNSTLSMDAKSFVVMTWNLLSPRLCHPLHLHYRCDQTHLEWNTRRETILNQIVFTDADIICLQEIEKQDFDEYFEPQLARLGYKSIHAYKTNLYEIRDGCALFYRDSRFKLNDHHILRYNQTDLDDEMRPSMARDTAIRFNLFHNLAIVALLENRRTHRLVQVATTHLLADPAYPDAKMLQSAILVSKLEELKAKALVEYGHCGYPATHTAHQHSHTHHCYHPAYYRPMARPDNKHTRTSSSSSSSMPAPFRPCPALDIPTIIAGDLNSLPHSSVISFLKTGRVETSHFGGYDFGRFTRRSHKYLHHSLELSDCYKDSTLPYTNITRNFEGTIDYMLFAKKSLSLIGFLDHLERPTTASSSSTTESNKSAGAKGNGNRSKKTKKMTVKFKKESEEKSLSLNRRGSTHSLQFALHDIGDADDYNNHDNGDHVDDVGHFRGEVSDSEEPATMSDSHGGELSGLGDDDSSGSDADQEDMHIGLRSSSSFTPTTIWSSLTPLQQQRLTLASRTFSSTTQPINKTSAVKARREATKTHSGTTTCAATTRYPLPTMPSQYFPSDHIPLAAVFKERDMTVCCCSQSCRRRTDDPKL
ncbi:Glucose-repressible alcohol dehydrogenase transcriptional effector [Actinomortierella wolfii]|nr:Glucose-repressible alcohol dehydrogenase transcriptional effector [Actinomortierella wolfii]